MRKLSRVIFVVCVVAIGAAGISLAIAHDQTAPSQTAQNGSTQPPARALSNLHQVAESLISDAAKEYDEDAAKVGKPDFPYPSAVQLQWDASMAAYGNTLTEQQRTLFPDCAAHLNTSIDDSERGYRIKITQIGNAPAQEEAAALKANAQLEYDQCDEAYKLAQSSVTSAPANPPQQTNATAEEAVPGTAQEAALPGSIDWTPPLDPLMQYLSREWQRAITDPKNAGWAPDSAGNSLTMRLEPDQPPQLVSTTGARKNVLENIMQNGNLPVIKFPNASKLTSVLVTPKFFVKNDPGRTRMRLKYYERDGVFKSYSVAVPQ